MANDEQLAILRQGVGVWNKWREANPDVQPNLGGAGIDEVDLQYPRSVDDHRKVGGGYIFIHRMLMEYFASLDTLQPPEQPSAQPE